MKTQKTLVVRVPADLAAEIEKKAREELLPTAGYVRRLLLKAATEEAPRAA